MAPKSLDHPHVFVVESDPKVRKLLAGLARSYGISAKECESWTEFADIFQPCEEGCLLLKLQVGPSDAGKLLPLVQIKQSGGCPPTVVITGGRESGEDPESTKVRIVGSVTGAALPEALLNWLRQGVDSAASDLPHRSRAVQACVAQLSNRERQVLDLLLAGRRNKHVAKELDLSQKTIATHRANILRKVGVESLLELARALEPGD
jgi:FixJ family two-component response regulator